MLKKFVSLFCSLQRRAAGAICCKVTITSLFNIFDYVAKLCLMSAICVEKTFLLS